MKNAMILRQSVLVGCLAGVLAALPVAGASSDEPQDEPVKVQAQKMVVVQQHSDGDHKVEIRCEIDNGKQFIDLTIDGKKYEVGSMEEANKILKKYGIEPVKMNFDFDLGADVEHEFHVEAMKRLGEGAHGRAFVMPQPKGEGEGRVQMFVLPEGGEGGIVVGGVAEPRGFLGVHLEEVPEILRDYLDLDAEVGVLISDIVDDSPAAHAGVKPNDILLGINRKGNDRTPVNAESLREFMSDVKPGEKLELRLLRAGKVVEFGLKAGEYVPEQFEFDVEGEAFGPGVIIDPEQFEHQFEWAQPGEIIDPEQFQHQFKWVQPGEGHVFQLPPGIEFKFEEFDPDQFFEEFEDDEGEFRFHALPREIQPMLGPDFHDLMKQMEEQMRQIEEMLMDLRRQQHELQKRVEDVDA